MTTQQYGISEYPKVNEVYAKLNALITFSQKFATV